MAVITWTRKILRPCTPQSGSKPRDQYQVYLTDECRSYNGDGNNLKFYPINFIRCCDSYGSISTGRTVIRLSKCQRIPLFDTVSHIFHITDGTTSPLPLPSGPDWRRYAARVPPQQAVVDAFSRGCPVSFRCQSPRKWCSVTETSDPDKIALDFSASLFTHHPSFHVR